MSLRLERVDQAQENELTATFVFAGDEDAEALTSKSRARHGFSAKLGETVLENNELAVGLGERPLSTEKLRRAGAGLARAAKSVPSVVIDPGALVEEDIALRQVVQSLGEGALLGAYRFTQFKSNGKLDELEVVRFVAAPGATDEGIARAQAIARAVSLARDLINTPAGHLSPRRFGEIAEEVAAASGLSVHVMDEAEIREARLGGLLGVAAGSDEPPRFVRLEYRPAAGGEVPSVALVGKGITFDSGGLSLKPPASMMTMKCDMSGAAAVLATMSVCRELGISVRVLGFMPLTENLPGGRATRPGDVLTTRNGKTIEVLNTDAEGRLVLSDALALAEEEHPDSIVDLATLTGACVVALGADVAGVFGNDDRLIEKVRAAAGAAGEPMWPLPLPAGYKSHIESEVADMKNLGVTGQAGAIAGAQLLAEFVGEVPWVHLDIAGPAWSEEDKGYRKKGGTGFGVRTLVELLESYTPLSSPAEKTAQGIAIFQ